jgi:hypothetical protein
MQPEIIALAEKHHLLIATLLGGVLLVGVFIGMTIEGFLSKAQRKAWREKNSWRWRKWHRGDNVSSGPRTAKPEPMAPKHPDAADQLRIVMGRTSRSSRSSTKVRPVSSGNSTGSSLQAIRAGR